MKIVRKCDRLTIPGTVFLGCLVLGLSSALGEPAKELTPREILLRANSESAKLKAIAFDASLFGDGVLAQQFPRMSGKVTCRRTADGKNLQLRVDAAGAAGTPSAGRIKYIVSDGQVLYAEESTKTVRTGKPEQAMGLPVNGLCPPKYLGDAVFRDEFKAASLVSEPGQAVEGVDCDVVLVTYDQAGTKSARFYIAKKDGLVRRIDNMLALRMSGRNEVFRGTIVFVASNLDPAPNPPDKTFAFEIPADYRQEPFAPVQQPSPAVNGQNSPAPDWELKSGGGQSVSLKSLRGKFVVLDFWATWCGPCKRAMPGMQKLHDRYKGKPVAVYGMNCWERSPDPMAYINSRGFTYPQLLAADQVAMSYGVSGIPAIFVINPEGKIVHTIRGFVEDAEDQIARIIDPNLPK